MHENELLETVETADISTKLRLEQKKLLTRIAIIIPVNILLYVFAVPQMPLEEKLFNSSVTFTVGFTTIGVVLGLIVAIFPYKGLPYGKKHFRASLWVMFVLLGIFFVILFIMSLVLGIGLLMNK